MKIERKLLFCVCLMCQAYFYSFSMENGTFRCHNDAPNFFGNYIDPEFFCTGYNTCSDAEDERLGCKREMDYDCGKGKFACDSDQCKHINVRCNTIRDCQDGTDELNCGDEVNVKNCTSEDKFLCKDGLRCLDLEYTCNNHCNCFDCSDENENCSKHDDDLWRKCPHAYFVTANGPQCFCGTSNASSSALCDGIEDCEEIAHIIYADCEQRCVQYKIKVQCSCYEGYQPMNGTSGVRCRTNEDFVILYTNQFEIKSVNNTSLETSTILKGIQNCTLLTAANNYVYYATSSHHNKGYIFKTSLNSPKSEKLIETGFPITSIAVDYLTNNVYFTSNGSLSVCTSDGRICTQLKCCNVTAVTLAPQYGWMFYVVKMEARGMHCQNENLLIRSSMDGSNETISSHHCYAGEISIDVDESRSIVYLFKRAQNEVMFYEILFSFALQKSHNWNKSVKDADQTRKFRFYNKEIFFTTGDSFILYFKNLTFKRHETKHSPIMYVNDSSASTTSIIDLFVYDATLQKSYENPCKKSSCSGLCLIKREPQPSMNFLSHRCFYYNSTSSGDNHRQSNDAAHRHVADKGVRSGWMVIFVLFIVTVSVAGFHFYKKQNCYGINLTSRRIERSYSEQRVFVSDINDS